MATSRPSGITLKTDDEEVRAALAQSQTAGEAIRNLYDLWKSKKKNFSLAILCKRAEMPSKGYVSDCMSGKRVFNSKYQNQIIKAFQLKGECAHYLKTLIAYENEKDEGKKLRKQDELTIAKKAINVQFMKMSKTYEGIFTALEVFCGFGLFHNRPTWQDLLGYFGEESKDRLNDALELLKSMNLIVEESREQFKATKDYFLLGEAEEGLSHAEFIKMALTHGSNNVEKWFPHKDQSYFASSVLSVRKDQYEKAVESLRSSMLLFQNELESSEADMLVRFNVQIYPAR